MNEETVTFSYTKVWPLLTTRNGSLVLAWPGVGKTLGILYFDINLHISDENTGRGCDDVQNIVVQPTFNLSILGAVIATLL